MVSRAIENAIEISFFSRIIAWYFCSVNKTLNNMETTLNLNTQRMTSLEIAEVTGKQHTKTYLVCTERGREFIHKNVKFV